ncbi:MAG: LytTR family DNA-binding domain-containing protein [Kofleriaceae bacterium]
MKALIVDDEPLARRELRRLLAREPSVEVVGEAEHVEDARRQVAALDPDLIFLDVEMPGGTGFDLLVQLDHVPHVIFTTAYDQHAVRAFDVGAVDYLLKPIEPERLAAAVARLPKPRLTAVATLERLFVRDGGRCLVVPLHEVRLLEAEGNYVRLYWGHERPLVGRSLAHLESRLDAQRFVRASRGRIFNLDFVESLEDGDGGRLHVQLRGGPEVEVSRRQARTFRARLSP